MIGEKLKKDRVSEKRKYKLLYQKDLMGRIQRALEWKGGNLYFNDWTYEMNVTYL